MDLIIKTITALKILKIIILILLIISIINTHKLYKELNTIKKNQKEILKLVTPELPAEQMLELYEII